MHANDDGRLQIVGTFYVFASLDTGQSCTQRSCTLVKYPRPAAELQSGRTSTMTGAAALLQPLLDLARDPATREAARTYFTSPTVTVNLIPAILVLGALAAALPLLGLPFLPQLTDLLGLGGGSGGGYGAPAGNILAIHCCSVLRLCAGGYGASAAGYSGLYSRGDDDDLSARVADLQARLDQLVASSEALSSQLYYGTTSAGAASL